MLRCVRWICKAVDGITSANVDTTTPTSISTTTIINSNSNNNNNNTSLSFNVNIPLIVGVAVGIAMMFIIGILVSKRLMLKLSGFWIMSKIQTVQKPDNFENAKIWTFGFILSGF